MVDRETKVTYRTRTLDRDEPRPSIPTALDPYDNPYAVDSRNRQRYNGHDGATSVGVDSDTTEKARSTTRTVYSVHDDDRTRSVYEDKRRSSRPESRSVEDVESRRSTVVDQRRDATPSGWSTTAAKSRMSRSRERVDVEVDDYRGRGREYYVDDKSRPNGGPIIIEARQGQIIDVTVPGSRGDRRYEQRGREYVYDDSRSSRGAPYDRDYDRDGRNMVVTSNNYSSAPTHYVREEYRPSRPPVRPQDYDRDEEWRLVDSMKETRISSHDARSQQQGRSRAPTQSSEDSYVMVSPSLPPKGRERSRSRSAIARTDYSENEFRRRRSRSISFRDNEVYQHDASERRHERPGAEASICGPYLRNPVPPSDVSTDVYGSFHETDRRSRDRREDSYAASYRERSEPYGPQIGYAPRKERSRRRTRDEDTRDDTSFYSENIIRKTTKEYR